MKFLILTSVLAFAPMFIMADNLQDQHYADERVRPYAELMRNLKNFTDDNVAVIGTIYSDVCVNQSPTWTDQRIDGVPNKLTPADLCAANAFFHDFQAFIAAESGGTNTNYNALLKAVVRQP